MIELEDEKIRWPKKLVERLVEKGGGTKSRDEIVFIRRSRSATKLQEVR